MKIPKNAEKWTRAMLATPHGGRVVRNVRQEENVPKEKRCKFFDNLARYYKLGHDPCEHMESVLDSLPECSLTGPSSDLGMELLTRFQPLARLVECPELKLLGISFQRLIAKPELVAKIQRLNLRNRRRIVWATIARLIELEFGRGARVDEIVNRLGIKRLTQPMCQLIYSAADVSDPCHTPTVLDAGARHHAFRPAAKGAKHGLTVPCHGRGLGFSEYVHTECTVAAPGIRVHMMGPIL